MFMFVLAFMSAFARSLIPVLVVYVIIRLVISFVYE